jgi:hypothetical protein
MNRLLKVICLFVYPIASGNLYGQHVSWIRYHNGTTDDGDAGSPDMMNKQRLPKMKIFAIGLLNEEIRNFILI